MASADSDTGDISEQSDSDTSDSDVCELRQQLLTTGTATGYAFEPEPVATGAVAAAVQPAVVLQYADRLGAAPEAWCLCSMCVNQTVAANCHCCRESPKLAALAAQAGVSCVTNHPGFAPVSLNVYVLDLTYNQYKHLYGDIDMPMHKRRRHLAYRNVVMWAWGRLGKRNRVPLPSCVLDTIRREFPAPDGQYQGHVHA